MDERRISDQRKRVVNLESLGRDARHAKELLAKAEELYSLHAAHVELLKQRLREASA